MSLLSTLFSDSGSTYLFLIARNNTDGDTTSELQGHTITVDDPTLNINIYKPPSFCCPPGYHSNLSTLLSSNDDENLNVGDFNARIRGLFSQTTDEHISARGNVITYLLNIGSLALLNEFILFS